LPDHKPFLVVQFKNAFYVDHVHPFGARPASSNSGQIGNAIVNIWAAEVKEHGLFFKLEDDINSFRFPDPHGLYHENGFKYRHDIDSILTLISSLNVPWHPKKLSQPATDPRDSAPAPGLQRSQNHPHSRPGPGPLIRPRLCQEAY
ncbi:hypothetical protein C0993_009957, partial [Termitomyces sp. T159_Od127]